MRHPKTYANPRPTCVFAGENAEGFTYSVMDHLDYGLSEPQLALMGDGDVFVAGQVQAPMVPPVNSSKEVPGGLNGLSMLSNSTNSLVTGTALTGTIHTQLYIAIYNGVPDHYTYQISPDANDGSPQMPNIPAVLSYTYQPGDLVEWKAEVSYTMPRNASKGNIPLTESFPADPSGPWVAGVDVNHPRQFPQGLLAFLNNGVQLIRGGELKLTARYTRAGKTSKPSVTATGIKILGLNPARASVDGGLTTGDMSLSTGVTLAGTDLSRWLKAIARQESYPSNSLNQFTQTAHGPYQVPGNPSLALNGDGGMGLMQITVNSLAPASRWDWLWNWDENVTEGKRIFTDDKIPPARVYPGQVRGSSAFQTAITQTNAWRRSLSLPPVVVNVPEFTAAQVLADATRGYNGYSSPSPSYDWQFGRSLHEFRIRTHVEAGFGLVLDLQNEQTDPNNHTQSLADTIWDEVPGSDRPNCLTCGDPFYVDHVRARLGAN